MAGINSDAHVTPAGRRGRGRPRTFDLDEIADAVLLLFWEHGFEATTLEQITERTGVKGSSLFAAYGSKRGLFMAAVERYRQHVGARLTALADGERGLDDVLTFVTSLRDETASARRPLGCLMVNTMVETGKGDEAVLDVIRSYREQLNEAFRAALTRAVARGEIPARSVSSRAQVLQASCFGALVIANVTTPAEVAASLDAMREEVKRWRTAPESPTSGRATRAPR